MIFPPSSTDTPWNKNSHPPFRIYSKLVSDVLRNRKDQPQNMASRAVQTAPSDGPFADDQDKDDPEKDDPARDDPERDDKIFRAGKSSLA
jgi:hypothetical protein